MSLTLDGALVQLEDLIRLDVRVPSSELTHAHVLLRLRRRIADMNPQSTAAAADIAALIRRRDLIDDDGVIRSDGKARDTRALLAKIHIAKFRSTPPRGGDLQTS